MLDAVVEVAVIGAGGPSGLASCKEAKSHGIKVTGFESLDRVGGLWCADSTPTSSRGFAHSGLETNISRILSVFPDFPWPKGTPVFPNTQDMFNYLNAYAEHFDLKKDIQFESRVTTVSREGNKWLVEWTKNNIPYKKYFDAIIIATGKQNKPWLPDFQGLDQIPKEKKMHSADFKSSDDFTGERVLIVGGSVSGTYTAQEVADSAVEVIHLSRKPRWMISRYLPDSSGRILPWDTADTYKMNATTLSPDEKFQNFSEICSHQQEFPELKMTSEIPFGMVFVDDYLKKVKEKRITPVRGEIDYFTRDSAVLKDGHVIKFDRVIFSTGYETTEMPSILPKSISSNPNEKKLYLYMFPQNTQQIVMIGLHYASRFSLLAQQAEFACYILSGKGKLPSEEEMSADMERILALAPVDYMNTLARLTGSFLDIEQFEKENPQLCNRLKSFPFLPSQNKLTGPYRNPTAATEIINDAYEYLRSVTKEDEVGLAVEAIVANAERVQRRNSSNYSNLEDRRAEEVTGVEEKKDEQTTRREFIEKCTHWFTNKIEYSVGPNIGLYKSVGSDENLDRYCEQIKTAVAEFRFTTAFKITLESKLASAVEQALFVAMMFKKSPMIDKHYLMLHVDTRHARDDYLHSFLVLIPRDSRFLKQHNQFNSKAGTVNGSIFSSENEGILFVDPWRRKVFEPSVNASQHPLDFTPSISFAETPLYFENMDLCYLGLQKEFNEQEFNDLYFTCLSKEMLRLTRNSPPLTETLKAALNSKDFTVVFRKASASPDNIKVVELLLKNREFLGLDIHAKGETSGNALDIATAKKNDAAIQLLRSHLMLMPPPRTQDTPASAQSQPSVTPTGNLK